MTKVQTKFQLSRALDDSDCEKIARVHSVFGILAARVEPSLKELFVEYDYSRLSLKEVRGVLAERGIPIV
ncbi:MAG TPA: hypothetical protein VKX25_11610 [Bryobacteraceae bacterium]|jgi:hypothetical protein|nr:hypothetical protein [Bryobacteraceae bacterium]